MSNAQKERLNRMFLNAIATDVQDGAGCMFEANPSTILMVILRM
ncbi:MAG: hypothetical protein ACXAC2_06380 [Candidatus Kariarchaeaceae archaeon]